MIEIAIVDDEKELREKAEACVAVLTEGEEGIRVQRFSSGNMFLEKLLNEEYEVDILLCDIEMPDMDGIEVGRRARKLCPQMYLIYLTGHAEYAAESYRICAYQYIMKDDMDKRLPEMLREILQRLKKRKSQYKIFSDGEKLEKVYYRDIISICKEKGQKYIRYTTVKREYRERTTIDVVQNELQSTEFMLIERGVIVNMYHVERICGNVIYLDNGVDYTVSMSRLRKVKEQMTMYWRK